MDTHSWMLVQPAQVDLSDPTEEVCFASAVPVPMAAVLEAEQGCCAAGAVCAAAMGRGWSMARG